MPDNPPPRHTFIVEHLDPELEAWQILEYNTIAAECQASSSRFLLTGLSNPATFHDKLNILPSNLLAQSVEKLYPTSEAKQRVCLLDPKAERDIAPEDGELFDVFLFGGILGDDPPRDRTSELRRLGFPGRRLGSEQMTTDTAARVTRIVVQDRTPLNEIAYIDRPDIDIPAADSTTKTGNSSGTSESVSMPFRYVKGRDGRPVMPEGMLDLLASDADKGITDLL